MKLLWSHLTNLSQQIKNAPRILLALDFDGTLSPLTHDYNQAALPSTTENLLKKLTRKPSLSLMIISGRSLNDIKAKVPIPGAGFAGNHGLEWEIDGHHSFIKLPPAYQSALRKASTRLKELLQKYPSARLQNKNISLSVHYRQVSPPQQDLFVEEFLELAKSFDDNLISLLPGKKVFDIRPKIDWTKGHIGQQAIADIQAMYGATVLSIFIGDDQTDEHAFNHLKHGITIRVGQSFQTKARFYIEDQRMINQVLTWLDQTVS